MFRFVNVFMFYFYKVKKLDFKPKTKVKICTSNSFLQRLNTCKDGLILFLAPYNTCQTDTIMINCDY